jgi:hypothetical protein
MVMILSADNAQHCFLWRTASTSPNHRAKFHPENNQYNSNASADVKPTPTNRNPHPTRLSSGIQHLTKSTFLAAGIID